MTTIGSVMNRHFTVVLLLFLGLLCPCQADGNIRGPQDHSKNVSYFRAGKGLDVVVDTQTGSATLWVDQKPWLSLPKGIQVVGWGQLGLVTSKVTHQNQDALFGTYTLCQFQWQGADDPSHEMETSFLIFEGKEMIIFEQTFPAGWTNPNPVDPKGKSFGVVAGFPTVDTHLLAPDLGYLVWGGCFANWAGSGNWSAPERGYADMFNGDGVGQPWVLHTPQAERAIVWSSMDNFFVSGLNFENGTITSGLRASLVSIPEKHQFRSVLVGGKGINGTLMGLGDVLLAKGNKKRSQVYDDFVLAHAGYFTDNGAYHYVAAHEPEYANMEEALLGVKEGCREKQIPIRYVQWDDWWMESKGDLPGMLSWVPRADVFPSGFTNWLDMPLALYAPGYSAENVWKDEYHWKSVPNERGGTSIPLDPKFYMDLFRNGTKIGMKWFEQDFLCDDGFGDWGLTNTDVDSGRAWLSNMDEAARHYNVKLQLCMPDAYHVLQSTEFLSVTNARGTIDNTRNFDSIKPLGQNSLLFSALGIFASRDNVWTSNANMKQEGCGNSDFCYEPNAHLDNAATVLSNGPYGIGDSVRYVNRTIVMYACRTDGWMLRPRWPVASLDLAYTEARAPVWAAHDDFGPFRWSYILGVDLTKAVDITPQRLAQGAIPSQEQMVAWKVVPVMPVTEVQVFSKESPFSLPKSEPLNLPYHMDSPSPPHTHYNAAPVLTNGMVLLGEIDKWATMSFGRVPSLQVNEDTVNVEIVGAPAERVTYAYMKDVKATVLNVTYTFPESCSNKVDQHDNPICEAQLQCNPSNGCAFLGRGESASVW